MSTDPNDQAESEAAMESAGGTPAARTYQALHTEIVADCERDLTAEAETHAMGAAPFGLNPMIFLPTVVRTLLDTVVDFAGEPIDRLAIASRDVIKTVVSQKALEFIDRLVHDIEDRPGV